MVASAIPWRCCSLLAGMLESRIWKAASGRTNTVPLKKGNLHQTRGIQEGRYFWFSYQAPARTLRRQQDIHLIRDGAAFPELAAVLASIGYSYGGLLLNFPSRKSLGTRPVDIPTLTPADLLVLTTKPPISDEKEEDRRKVARSHTSLEERVLAALDPFFEICSRAHVKLSRTLSARLPRRLANRANILFATYSNACCKVYQSYAGAQWDAPDNPNITITYLAYTPRVWPDGPALLLSFGMGGIETLMWNLLLRTQHSSLLEEIVACGQRRFLMGEMTMPTGTSQPPVLLRADSYESTLVVNTSLP